MDLTPFTPQRLIRYAAPAALQAAYVSPYARAAGTAYRHRASLARAGRLAKWMYARRKQFVNFSGQNKKRKMGTNSLNPGLGAGSAKKTQLSNNVPANFNTRELLFSELTNINKTEIDIANNLATTNLEINRINRRQRQIVFIRGFSIDQYVQNLTEVPLLMNVAVVQPINSVSVSTSGWFRDYNESRDVDFSTGLGALQIHEHPISTDKYRILLHKRYTIAPKNNTGQAFNPTGAKNYQRHKHYVKFNKQIRFNDDSTTFAEQRVYLAFWCDFFNAGPGTVVSPNAYNVATKTTVFWDETTRPY